MATTTIPPGPMIMNPRTEEIIEAMANEDEIRQMSADEEHHKGIRERVWGIAARVDPTVTFEEYRYWAKIERQLEEEENKKYIAGRGPTTFLSVLKGRFSKGVHHEAAKKEMEEEKRQRERALQGTEESEQWSGDEKRAGGITDPLSVAPPPADAWDKDAEWRKAARALRTASWGTIFYLVTTDILGWSGAP